MYDLIIIGGGPAGYNAANRAAEGGLKTCVVEKRALGGVCLNEGCVPTKTLIHSSKVLESAKHASVYGVTVENATLDHAAVVKRKDKVVKTLVGGVAAQMKAGNIDVKKEEGVILGRTDEGFEVQAGAEKLVGARLLICTGSEPTLPPIDGLYDSLANGFALTNREILDLTEAPKRLAVVGGGVIGLEISSYFNAIGTEVTVLEMLDHIAGPTEREISEAMKKDFIQKGVKFLLGAQVTSIKDGKVSYKMNGEDAFVEADKVLVSIGRRAVTKGVGLENIGVLTERGRIVTDDQLRTNVPGVWAAGDVNGKIMLAHTAYREGEVAVNDMLGKKDRMDYLSIPSVIYTHPEVASVGETTESAKEKGLDVEIRKVSLRFSGRYLAENEKGQGFLKIIIDKQHKKILGVHIYGPYASEMIYGCAMMVAREMRVQDVQKFVFPHPTVGEVIREALFG